MRKADWGPPMWKTIHYVALGYPENPTEEDKQAYEQFYTNIYKIIPCKKPCSVHYKNMVSEFPVKNFLDNRDRLFEWTVIVHNKVNTRLGKPIISLDKARNMYDKKKDYTTLILLLLLVFGGIVYFYRKKRS